MLGAEESIWVDVAAFEGAVADAWRLDDVTSYEQAVDLYAGDLLPEDPYEEWITGRRTSLRASFLTLLTRAGRRAQEQGQVNRAIEIFQWLVAGEPVQEDAHVALMQLYALNGQRRQALAQYDQLVEILERELEAEPERITRALMEAIRDGLYPGKVNETPLTAAVTLTSNLPTPVGLLVGREREIAETRQMLSSSRLVTLTGPGGIGKTRLSIAVGHELRGSFEHGVSFVPLASIRDPGLVVAAVAKALDVREVAGDTLVDTVKTFLRSRRLLLVLDNFEHVTEAAPQVTELLEHASGVKALVTSRVRLRLRGEQEYEVSPLLMPEYGKQTGVEVAAYSSVTLFSQIARQARPDFQLVDANATIVASICRRLDGLPLAIELAAARTKVLSPHAILNRLDHPLTFLTGGSRDLPVRQQTIRDTVQWSYDLLRPDEQWLLRRLSVFAGGWTLEAAEQIAHGMDVLEGLTALVDASLVTHRTPAEGETRYGMLEVIREYALEQAQATGELDQARLRHAAYVSGLAAAVEPLLFGSKQIETLDLLEVEQANIRLALTWYVENEDAHAGLELAGRLWRFWWLHGHWTEARDWYDNLFAFGLEDIPLKVHATALTGAGAIAERQHDLTAATAWHEEALSTWLDLPLPDRGMACWSLVSLGATNWLRGNYEHADPLFEEALQLAQRLDDPKLIAVACAGIGLNAAVRGRVGQAIAVWERALDNLKEDGDSFIVAQCTCNIGVMLNSEGDYERGKLLIEEGITLNRRVGNKYDLAIGLGNLAWVELVLGRVDVALTYIEETVSIARDLGDQRTLAGGMSTWGDACYRLGDLESSERHYREGMTAVRSVGDPPAAVDLLIGFGMLCTDLGQVERAVRLAAAVLRVETGVGIALDQLQRADIEEILDRGRQALPEDTFAAAWECGNAMTLDAAIEHVLSE
ncbi:BTAD domain-containing putative transcriptional regulator [soil metagenome]